MFLGPVISHGGGTGLTLIVGRKTESGTKERIILMRCAQGSRVERWRRRQRPIVGIWDQLERNNGSEGVHRKGILLNPEVLIHRHPVPLERENAAG